MESNPAGHRPTAKTKITAVCVTETDLRESAVEDVRKLTDLSCPDGFVWVDVGGLVDSELISQLGEVYGYGRLMVEDILNEGGRSKVANYGDTVFLSIKTPRLDAAGNLVLDHIALILREGVLVSFHGPGVDLLGPAERFLHYDRHSQRRSPDYLMYIILDYATDNYFLVLNGLEENIDALERTMIEQPGPQALKDLYNLKNNVMHIRRAAWPIREALSTLDREGAGLLGDDTRPFYKDVSDQVLHILESLEISREMLGGMLDLYLSTASNRLNEVMKTLTIIATIFMPLTLVAGIYGMNFKYFPELYWPWGYPAVMTFMVVVALLMLAYFRRRKWL